MELSSVIKKAIEFAEIGGIKIEHTPTLNINRVNEYYLYHDLAEIHNDRYKDSLWSEDIKKVQKELADEFIILAVKIGMHGLTDIFENIVEKAASENIAKLISNEDEAEIVVSRYKAIGIEATAYRTTFVGKEVFAVKLVSTGKILKPI